MNGGLRIADCGLKNNCCSTPSLHHFVTPSLVVLLLVGLVITPAMAQGIDVTASLSLTDGAARAEAYVPVTLKITNNLGGPIDRITVSTGGPVVVTVPWSIAAGASDEKIVPVYYSGGDLRLTIFPGGSFPAWRTLTAPVSPTVRALGLDEVFVAASSDLPDNVRQMLMERLRAKSLRVMNLSPEARAWADRCGMLDAVVILNSIKGGVRPTGRAMFVTTNGPEVVTATTLPLGTEAAVQPEAYRLFGQDSWPAAVRSRLWLWLGIFALSTGVAAALISRRRTFVAVAVLVGLSAGAGAFLWFEGDLRAAPIREARIIYDSSSHEILVETFVSCTTSGKQASPISISFDPAAPLPLPVVASSEALLTPQMVLDLGAKPCVRPERDQLLIHTLHRTEVATYARPTGVAGQDLLGYFIKQPGVIAAYIFGEAYSMDKGRRLRPDEKATGLIASSDPDTAYAGRSLLWWYKNRCTGPTSVILAWWHDPLPPTEAGQDRERLPALVVYQLP
jgi:hypothetical protein